MSTMIHVQAYIAKIVQRNFELADRGMKRISSIGKRSKVNVRLLTKEVNECMIARKRKRERNPEIDSVSYLVF